MTDIFANYRPPGVYAQEATTPLVTNVGINPTVIALLGPSVGYRVNTESITLDGTTPVTLAKQGINASTIVVTKDSGAVAVLDTDYAVDVDEGTTNATDVTSIIRDNSGGTIGDGEAVTVSYQFTDEAYYDPLRVTSYEEVKDAFGEPLDRTDGSIVSPLSLAAKFALDNGATRLVLIPVTGSATSVDVDDLASSYAAALALEDVSIVVPMPVGINGTDGSPGDTGQVGTDLKNHVEGAEDDGIYRVGILGYETGVTVAPPDLAGGIASRRVMIAYPNRMGYYNSFLNTTIELPGYYLAAAYAGRFASLPVQYPLTRKTIRGFSSIPTAVLNAMTRTTKDTMSRGGVAVTEPSTTRGLICRHGVTTDPTSVLTREISIVRQQDTMIRAIMESLDLADLIGTPIMEETPVRIKGVVQGVLESMVDADVIVGYSGLSVRQIEIDPTVIEVKYLYAPSYPNNYILITYGIDTSTGALAVTAANENPEVP